MKTGDSIGEDSFAIIKKINQIENPVLRHFIKKFNLDVRETLLLGVLIEITNVMKTELKTSYDVLSEETGLLKIDIYRGLNSLHRHGIILFKSDRKNLLHIGFTQLSEDIEEISLAYKNAGKIRQLRRDVDILTGRNFIPRSDLFDAIYPLTGEIIARKISEAFMNLVNYLNEKLERGLSTKNLRLRIKSFFTGIPAGELLLLDSLPFMVDEIFMLERDSGILLASASRDESEKVDRDMVGGMLTAINEFVRTAFNSGKQRELDEIKYGKHRIVIRASQYFFLAFVINGAPTLEFMNATDSLAYSLHIKYRNRLKKFNGDTAEFGNTIPVFNEFMSAYNTPPVQEKTISYRKIKIAAGIVLSAIIILTVNAVYSCYIDHMHEEEAEYAIRNSVTPDRCDAEVEFDGNKATVRGYASDSETIKAVTATLASLDYIERIDNRMIVMDFMLIREYNEKIETLTSRVNELETETARKNLEAIKIEFPVNSTDLNSTARIHLDRAASIMKNFPAIKIDLAAFSDYSGSIEINQSLASSRMNSITSYLESRGISRNRIKHIDFDPDYVKNDPRVISSPQSRGVVIYASTQMD